MVRVASIRKRSVCIAAKFPYAAFVGNSPFGSGTAVICTETDVSFPTYGIGAVFNNEIAWHRVLLANLYSSMMFCDYFDEIRFIISHKDYAMFNKQLRYFLSAATLATVGVLATVPVPANADAWAVMCPARVSPSTRVAITKAVDTYTVTVQQSPGVPTIPIHGIVVLNGYALVDWVGGQEGGEAVLQSSGSTWKVLSMGGGQEDQASLMQLGIPRTTAFTLFSQILACEQGHYPHCGSNGVCTQSTSAGKPPR